MVKQLKNIKLFLKEGAFEIINLLEHSNKPIQYKEITFTKNNLRGNFLSSKTISQRLKELETNEIIKKEFIKTNSKTRFGYAITDYGRKSMDILKETQNKFETLKEKY